MTYCVSTSSFCTLPPGKPESSYGKGPKWGFWKKEKTNLRCFFSEASWGLPGPPRGRAEAGIAHEGWPEEATYDGPEQAGAEVGVGPLWGTRSSQGCQVTVHVLSGLAGRNFMSVIRDHAFPYSAQGC